jgi:AcrR family transcriptional regulator
VVDIASRRAQFVAASLDVIAVEGLRAATMRRIATQAGVTTGAITRYFSGREELLLEVVRAAHIAAGLRMQRAVQHGATATARLEAVILQVMPLDDIRMREWKIWSAFRGVLPGKTGLWAANEAGYGAWRAYLHTLLEPLCLDADSVRQEASLLVALVDGIGFRLAAMTVGAAQLAAEQRTMTADVQFYLQALTCRQARRARK